MQLVGATGWWRLVRIPQQDESFNKYRDRITKHLQDELAADLKACKALSIAVDEKEIQLVCVIHFVSADSTPLPAIELQRIKWLYSK